MTDEARSEIRDGMRIDWDVPIPMDDGVVLRCDVYRPIAAGKYPVVLSYGPYGKWLHFEQIYKTCWDKMVAEHPEVPAGSTNRYQNWEVVDPEKWVPDGYACVRVDSRGCGRSPGYVDLWGPRETRDFAQCIEWAGGRPWSNGKVGLNGISYYAMNQFQVGALQPKYLAAMCAWEGANDWYREVSHHGGILCTFLANWYDMQVKTVQHGLGTRGFRSPMTGDWVCGPQTLAEEALHANRFDFGRLALEHEFDDEFWQSRTPDWSKIRAPLLSNGNWGGQGLHPRGNIEGYLNAGSEQKWLEMHGDAHWTHFYTDYGVRMQKKFFGYFLKGEQNGWDRQPKVLLQIRHPGERFVERAENEWPLARTQWTKFHLDARSLTLAREPAPQPGEASYQGLAEGLTFLAPPLEQPTEITGPIAAKVFISSATADADFFLIVRAFDPNMKELTCMGALDPHTPLAQGWLRASHRKLDPKRSLPYRPYHPHDSKAPLQPGQVYELDIEVWPTCIVLPAGYRIALTVRGKDYTYPGGSGGKLSNMKNEFTGVGPFLHNDARDRPPEIFNGYFLKTEITAQKLHSIVISSLRTYKGLKALRPHGQSGPARQTGSSREHPERPLDDELERNIRRGAAHLVAQPQLHLASNAIVGMEVIANWKTRDGVLGPAQLAEAVHDLDLRLKADEWLLRQGCAWAKSWQALGIPSVRVSLPLVTEQVWNRAFLALVERCLEEFELAPGTLDVEVPEHALLDARSQARDALAFVQAKGVSVTLLDFGAEMISLPWLQRLLPDRVRIHRTFVRNVTQDNEKTAIARTLIALAHTIGMTVIADGIATELDLQFFRWEGCDIGQGDFVARSLAVQDVSEFLRSSKTMTH